MQIKGNAHFNVEFLIYEWLKVLKVNCEIQIGTGWETTKSIKTVILFNLLHIINARLNLSDLSKYQDFVVVPQIYGFVSHSFFSFSKN